MKVAVASDHAGYEIKQAAISFLSQKGIFHTDFGCGPDEQVDYVDFAAAAVESICRGEHDRAILVCGTGIGMAMTANKYRGIRATPCWDEFTAEMSRKHNDSNCLTLGGRILPPDEALRIVDIWLNSEFEAGRHQRRIDKLLDIEEKNFKAE